MQQVMHVIVAQAGIATGPVRIVVALRPDHLGRVEVALLTEADRPTRLHISVERPETLLLLQRDRATLDTALQAAGFDTAKDYLSLSLSDPGQQNAPHHQPHSQGSGRRRAAFPIESATLARPATRHLLSGVIDLAL